MGLTAIDVVIGNGKKPFTSHKYFTLYLIVPTDLTLMIMTVANLIAWTYVRNASGLDVTVVNPIAGERNKRRVKISYT